MALLVQNGSRFSLLVLLATALALFAGCASLDPTSVEESRRIVKSARGDGRIDASRSIDMQEAERHLQLAEKALDSGRFQDEVDHQAYLAAGHAKIAKANAAANTADRTASNLLNQARRQATDTRQVVELAVERARALQATQTERGIVLTLGGVLFGFDSAELKPEAARSAARVAGFLIALGDRNVLVEGHTDSKGTEEYNVELSLRRAESVRASLIEDGVAPDRIVSEGFGPAFPIASNDDEAGRAKNRRVEVIILEPGRTAADSRR